MVVLKSSGTASELRSSLLVLGNGFFSVSSLFSSAQAGSQEGRKLLVEELSPTLSDRLKHLQQLLRANKDGEVASELHLSALVDMVDIWAEPRCVCRPRHCNLCQSDWTDKLLGQVPGKADVLLGEEHRADVRPGPFSHGCLVAAWDGMSWLTVSLWHTAEHWLVWDSFLFCFTGTETSQMLFLEGLKLTLSGNFSFYQLLWWVNIASPGENYKVAGTPGNIRAIALHRHSLRGVSALFPCFMQKLLCSSTVVWNCCFVAQEFQYCHFQVSATCGRILYLMMLYANPEGFLCCWAQVLLYWIFTALKPDELLILQINFHAGKQDTFFSKQLWRNDFPFFFIWRADYLCFPVFEKLWLWKLKTFVLILIPSK